MYGKSQRYSKELKAVKMYMQDGLSAIQIVKELELTDKGFQHTNKKYCKLLEINGVTGSKSKLGN